jgi:hypothetical protein
LLIQLPMRELFSSSYCLDKLAILLEIRIEGVRSVPKLGHRVEPVIFIADLKTEQAISHDLRDQPSFVSRTLCCTVNVCSEPC